MPASSYGIIVEGGYDSTVYEAIIRRLASHDVHIISRPCDGRTNLTRKFPGFLETFKYVELTGSSLDLAFVIVDADGRNPAEVEAKLRAKVAGRQYPFEVHFHAVQNAMEAWLLADAQAISRVIHRRVGRSIARTHDAPQGLLDPKPTLTALLEGNRIDYTPAVAGEIAHEVDPQILSARCPRFRVFADLVDC